MPTVREQLLGQLGLEDIEELAGDLQRMLRGQLEAKE